MEKELFNQIFEALGLLVFPIENTEGKKNPATKIFLHFLKEVLKEIQSKNNLDYFLYNWNEIQKKFRSEFDNSFFSSNIKLIYGNINQILVEKNTKITCYSCHRGVDHNFVKKIKKNLLLVIQESRDSQIKSGWIDNNFNSLMKK